MIYHAVFNVATVTGLSSITISRGGESNIVVDLAAITGTDHNSDSTTMFSHYDRYASWEVTGQDADGTQAEKTIADAGFAAALQTAIISAGSAWASKAFVVECVHTTGAYTIEEDSAFALAFTTDATGDFLGFSDDSDSAASHSSDQTPTYCVIPTLGSVSDPTLNYETGDVATSFQASDGSGSGMSRGTSAYRRDWVQEFESKAKTVRLSAGAAHPWTLQHLREHTRGEFPFIVHDGFGSGSDEMFRNAEGGAVWDAQDFRATPGNDNHFHVPFRCMVMGTVVTS